MVVTGHSSGGGAGAMRRLFPLLRAWAALDALAPIAPGYMLIATATRR
jgi:hypothetical protein